RNEIAATQRAFAGLRRYGAAALDLAWIAAGRLDAYWERDLSPWDLAAGALLVREAGGFVTDIDGGDAILQKGNVVAGNETMHRELLRLLREAEKAAAKDTAVAPLLPWSFLLRQYDAARDEESALALWLRTWQKTSPDLDF